MTHERYDDRTATGLLEATGDETALPTVSVVVPVLDAAEEIGRLLESLVALDYPSELLELIVVDNGSTDGTPEVVSRFPVELHVETRLRSSYAARNRGVAAARGEWVAFTDADCVATRGWLRSLLSPRVPDAAGAVAGEVHALELETPVQRLTERFGIMRHEVTLPHKALPGFSTANVAIRRSLLQTLGGFRDDVRFFGDMELSWRMQLVAGAAIVFRPRAVILHRHRRSFAALGRQGCQHGRGVAFMKRTYPDRYRIHLGEQFGRIGSIARAAWGAIAGVGDGPRPSATTASPQDRSSGGGARRIGAARVPEPDPFPGSGDAARLARPGEIRRDRIQAPLFLAIWYGTMFAGYLMGPARARRGGAAGALEGRDRV